MSTVQVLVQREAYAGSLSSLLAREGVYEVARVQAPDFDRDGVIVADRQALERYPALLQHAERLVLIAPNDPNLLAILWEHNIRSVVFESDPPSTAVLAILGSDIENARPLARIIAIDTRAASPNAAQISPKRAM